MNGKSNDAIEHFRDNYHDTVNNFTLDIQQQVSRFREVEIRHTHFISKLMKIFKRIEDLKDAKSITDPGRLQKMLMDAFDMADKELDISTLMSDMVKTRMCDLDTSYKEAKAEKLRLTNSNKRSSKPMPDNNDIDSDSIDVQNTSNSNKRPKRNVTKLSATLNEKSLVMNARFDRKSSTNQNKIKNTSNKQSKVQPTKIKKLVSGSESSGSDGDGDADLQPTYCVCEEISYGDMIACDNDLCPLEWCHFGCVSISEKPKGKWYCPFCRGTNSKTMKPKKVFLKELENYNKRKEEN